MASALAAACHSPTTVCTDIELYPIALTVLDSITGATPATAPVIIVESAGRTDTLANLSVAPPGQPYFLGAAENGPFSLIVRLGGYRDWNRSNITVQEDACGHPVTVHLAARLQR